MFTGIIETIGNVVFLQKENSNLHIVVESSLASELKIDQSISHNGVCLTVTGIEGNSYTVTAIEETLNKTNFNYLKINSLINLERCLKLGERLDGHMVQGHIDTISELISIENRDGSYLLTFSVDDQFKHLIVEKGSICLNGISLTIVEVDLQTAHQLCKNQLFSVAIIPFTWENTNFQYLQMGDDVNVEFDIIGKYVNRMINS